MNVHESQWTATLFLGLERNDNFHECSKIYTKSRSGYY